MRVCIYRNEDKNLEEREKERDIEQYVMLTRPENVKDQSGHNNNDGTSSVSKTASMLLTELELTGAGRAAATSHPAQLEQ